MTKAYPRLTANSQEALLVNQPNISNVTTPIAKTATIRCADCGEATNSDLCPPCTAVAKGLGCSIPDRLAMLGVLPLKEGLTDD